MTLACWCGTLDVSTQHAMFIVESNQGTLAPLKHHTIHTALNTRPPKFLYRHTAAQKPAKNMRLWHQALHTVLIGHYLYALCLP